VLELPACRAELAAEPPTQNKDALRNLPRPIFPADIASFPLMAYFELVPPEAFIVTFRLDGDGDRFSFLFVRSDTSRRRLSIRFSGTSPGIVRRVRE
jgi:hypothetical protein